MGCDIHAYVEYKKADNNGDWISFGGRINPGRNYSLFGRMAEGVRTDPSFMQIIQKGDRIIWDSHFGYDIGYFIGNGNQYNTYRIDIITGRFPGEVCHSKDEIHLYSESLVAELTAKYGYEKSFAKDF